MAFEDQVKDALLSLLKKPDTLPAEFKSWLIKTTVSEGGSLKSLGVTLTAIDWPIGFPLWSPGAVIPGGMIEFDGRVLAQATYPIMFGLYNTSWNTGGEGAENFRIPDLRERSLFGKGTKTEVNTVGKTDPEALGARGPIHATTGGTLAANPHHHDINAYASVNEVAGYGLTLTGTFEDRVMVAVGAGQNTDDTTVTLTGAAGGAGPDDSSGYATGIWIGNPG